MDLMMRMTMTIVMIVDLKKLKNLTQPAKSLKNIDLSVY